MKVVVVVGERTKGVRVNPRREAFWVVRIDINLVCRIWGGWGLGAGSRRGDCGFGYSYGYI